MNEHPETLVTRFYISITRLRVSTRSELGRDVRRVWGEGRGLAGDVTWAALWPFFSVGH